MHDISLTKAFRIIREVFGARAGDGADPVAHCDYPTRSETNGSQIATQHQNLCLIKSLK